MKAALPILGTSALSGFLDLVQLADHPGDRLAYRHFRMTPLAARKYPEGVPDAATVSIEMAWLFAEEGLAGGLRKLRALLPADPAVAWDASVEEKFGDLLRAAEEFERAPEPDARLSDFRRFLLV